jgi:hypothetical protein
MIMKESYRTLSQTPNGVKQQGYDVDCNLYETFYRVYCY